jgi:hypothetical protein
MGGAEKLKLARGTQVSHTACQRRFVSESTNQCPHWAEEAYSPEAGKLAYWASSQAALTSVGFDPARQLLWLRRW